MSVQESGHDLPASICIPRVPSNECSQTSSLALSVGAQDHSDLQTVTLPPATHIPMYEGEHCKQKYDSFFFPRLQEVSHKLEPKKGVNIQLLTLVTMIHTD